MFKTQGSIENKYQVLVIRSDFERWECIKFKNWRIYSTNGETYLQEQMLNTTAEHLTTRESLSIQCESKFKSIKTHHFQKNVNWSGMSGLTVTSRCKNLITVIVLGLFFSPNILIRWHRTQGSIERPMTLDVLTVEGWGVSELTVFKAQQGCSHSPAHTHTFIHPKILIQTHPYSTQMQGSTGQRSHAPDERGKERNKWDQDQCGLQSHCRQRWQTGGGW